MARTLEELLLKVTAQVQGSELIVRLSQELVGLGRAQTVQAKAQAASVSNIAGSLNTLGPAFIRNAQGVQALASGLDVYRFAADAARAAGEELQAVLAEGFNAERNARQFETLIGSAEGARKTLANLRTFSQDYGLNFNEVVEGARELAIVGITGESALKTLANASVATGRSFTELARSLAGVQRGSLRGFLELVPAASSAVRKAEQDAMRGAGKSAGELRQLVTGALSELEAKYGGSLDSFAKGNEATTNRVANLWADLRERIYNSGVGAAVARVTSAINDKLKELAASGDLRRFAETIGKAMTAGVDALLAIAKATPTVVNAIKAIGTAAGWTALTVSMASIVRFGPTVVAFFNLLAAGGLRQLPALLTAATVGMGRFGAAVQLAMGPVGWVTLALTTLTLGLGFLRDKMREPYQFKVSDEGSIDVVDARIGELRKQLAVLKGDTAAAKATAASIPKAPEFAGARAAAAVQVAIAVDKQTAAEQGLTDAYKARVEAMRGLPSVFGEPPQAKPKDDPKDTLDEETRKAAEFSALTERTAQQYTEVWQRAVDERLAMSRAEGADRLLLYDRVAAEERQRVLVNGAARAEVELRLEQEIASRRAAIRASGASSAGVSKALQDLEAEAAARRRALDAAESTGAAQQALDRKLVEGRTKTRIEGSAQEKDAEAKALVDGLRFERDMQGQSLSDYKAMLDMRRALEQVGSANYKALLDETRAAEQADRDKRAADERRYWDEREELRKRAVTGGKEGAAADNYAATMQGIMSAQDDYVTAAEVATNTTLMLYTNMFAGIAGVADKTYSEMTEGEKRRYQLAVAFAGAAQLAQENITKGAVKRLTLEFQRYFMYRATSERLLTEVVKSAAVEAAGAGLDALGALAEAEAKRYLALGIASAAAGNFASAAKYGAAAALLTTAAGLAGGLSAALREKDAASAGQFDANRDAAAFNAQNAASGKAVATNMRVSEQQVPITMNFYITESFEGGIYFFGRDGAQELVAQIVPALQEAIDNRQLVVR